MKFHNIFSLHFDLFQHLKKKENHQKYPHISNLINVETNRNLSQDCSIYMLTLTIVGPFRGPDAYQADLSEQRYLLRYSFSTTTYRPEVQHRYLLRYSFPTTVI